VNASWVQLGRRLAAKVFELRFVFDVEIDVEAIVQKRPFEDEMDQGVEGVPNDSPIQCVQGRTVFYLGRS